MMQTLIGAILSGLTSGFLVYYCSETKRSRIDIFRKVFAPYMRWRRTAFPPEGDFGIEYITVGEFSKVFTDIDMAPLHILKSYGEVLFAMVEYRYLADSNTPKDLYDADKLIADIRKPFERLDEQIRVEYNKARKKLKY